MKFCLSSRQTPEYLKQADEIRVLFRDYKQIYDLINNFPNATISLVCENFNDDKFKKALEEFVVLAPNRLILQLSSFRDIEQAKAFHLPYYMLQPIVSLNQLRAVKDLGVCYAMIDGPICHQLHEAKIIGVPLRIIPNVAHLDSIPRDNGIAGNWFLPENIDDYSLYIDMIEFGLQPERREQALFRIYHNEKSYLGELGKLIQGLNVLGESRYINHEFLMRRMNCNSACDTSKNCTLCYDLINIAKNKTEENNIYV